MGQVMLTKEQLEILTDKIISKKESQRFLKCVQNLRKLKSKDLKGLNVEILNKMRKKIKNSKSIF